MNGNQTNSMNAKADSASILKQIVFWGIIVVTFILFFPIGILFLILKLHTDKEHFVLDGKVTAILGWIFVAVGIIYMIMGITGGLAVEEGKSVAGDVILMLVICCGGGYALVRHGNKYTKLGKLWKKYKPLIIYSKDGSIDGIAASAGDTFEETNTNIQKMIDRGLLKDSYIDASTRCLVSPIVRGGQRSAGTVPAGALNMARPQLKNIKCPNCGGMNTMTENSDGLCEFCGSPLT